MNGWATFGLILLGLVIHACTGDRARAHDAASGWSYPFSCCSNYDCRKVDAGAIEETGAGFTIKATGEFLPNSDTRVKRSPDQDFHWCSIAGKSDSRTVCLFVPPRLT